MTFRLLPSPQQPAEPPRALWRAHFPIALPPLLAVWGVLGLGGAHWLGGAVPVVLTALVAIVSWDVLRAGAMDLLVDLRLTRDGCTALGALLSGGVGALFLLLSAAGRLTSETAAAAAGTGCFLLAVAGSVLTARCLERGLATGSRAASPRPGPAAAAAESAEARAAAADRLPPPERIPALHLAASCGAAALALHASSGIPAALVATAAAILTAALAGTLLASPPPPQDDDFSRRADLLGDVDVVLLQKHAVLSEGRPEVTSVLPLVDGVTKDRIVHLATVAELGSEHPVESAILKLSAAHGRTIPNIERREHIPDLGIVANLKGRMLMVGNLRLLERESWAHSDLEDLSETTRRHWEKGETVLYACLEGRALGAIALEDPVREEARRAVGALKRLKVETGVLSGDTEQTTAALVRDLGLVHIYGGVSETEEAARVADLERSGKTVAIVRRRDREARLTVSVGAPQERGDGTARAAVELQVEDLEGLVALIGAGRARGAGHLRRRWARLLYHLTVLPLLCGAFYPWTGVPACPGLAAWSAVLVAWATSAPRRSPEPQEQTC